MDRIRARFLSVSCGNGSSRLRAAAAAAVLVLPLVAPGGSAAASFPGPPALLNTNAATDSGHDFSAQVTTDGAGTWVAVWASFDDLAGTIGTDLDVLFARSVDGGVNWTAPAPLNTNAASDVGQEDFPQVETDGAGTWLAVWNSTDSLGGTIGTDYDILIARSVDDGATWSAPEPLNTNAATDSGHDTRAQVTTDGAGTWVAVWDSQDSLGGTIGTDRDILVARSMDDGATWSVPAALDTNAATDSGDDLRPQVATDGAGTWVAVWDSIDTLGGTIGADSDVLFVRSTDDAATWTAAAPLNTNAAADSGGDFGPYISNAGAGAWLAVWSSSDDLGGTIGIDSDILVARSADGGATWTVPAPLNSNAATDSGGDTNLQLTTDAAGRSLAVWNSTDDLGGTIGTDVDILVSQSLDGGATWTAPGALNSNAATDTQRDVRPQLATDGAGTWLAVWDSADLAGPLVPDGDILVSIGAICGDDFSGPGEECDDGNVVPDDGCSAACTIEPCTASPAFGCLEPATAAGRLKISVKAADPAKNQLQWKWGKGAATLKSDFGDPLVDEDYHLCIYDAGVLVSTTRIPAAGDCDGKPCWKETATGFQFKDKTLASDGAQQLKLKEGDPGKAQAQFKGRGATLELPLLTALTGPIQVQLKQASDVECWNATFGAPFLKQDAATLLDESN